MVAGQGSREQAEARRLAYCDPGKFAAIIDRIEAVTVDYLSGQIEAGVDAVQLFDSWSGSLAPAEFERWVIAPTARIVDALRARHPDVPIIGFPKGAGGKLARLCARNRGRCDRPRRDGRSGLGQRELPAGLPVQGNLDPLALIAGGERCATRSQRILDALSATGRTSSIWATASSRHADRPCRGVGGAGEGRK